MAVHFSTPKSLISFSPNLDDELSRASYPHTKDIRQLTEEVAQKILLKFLEHQVKEGKPIDGKPLSQSALNLEVQNDPRLELIGSKVLKEDPALAKAYRQEQLEFLAELLMQYPCAQHLNLTEFLGMLILESWDLLSTHLPPDFAFAKDSFFQEFWRFYLTSHVAAILYSYCESDEAAKEFPNALIGSAKQWSLFKPFLGYLLELAKAVNQLPDTLNEKQEFSKRLQLLIQLTSKTRSLFFPESLIAFYPKGFHPCQLQDLEPSLVFLSTLLQAITQKQLHSEKQGASFCKIEHDTNKLIKCVQKLKNPCDQQKEVFSKIIQTLSDLVWEMHRASLDREEDLALCTMKAKLKDVRAACVFDISSYKILIQFFRGIIESTEHSSFYYPAKSLQQRILSTMQVTMTAEQSSYTIESKLAAILPGWEQILKDCCGLNLENSQKNYLFGTRALKLSDPSHVYGQFKRPFFELFTHQHYLKSQETSLFIEKVKNIQANALQLLSKLPAHLNAPSTQILVSQEIQVALTLKFLEFYLHRDIEHLVHNNNLMITDCIPDEFFELLSIQIPSSSLSSISPISVEDDLIEEFDRLLEFSPESCPTEEQSLNASEQEAVPASSDVSIPTNSPPSSTKFKHKPRTLSRPLPTASAEEVMFKTVCDHIHGARKYRQIEKILNSLNLYVSGQTGSHAIFTGPSGAQVVVPKHSGKDIKRGTLSSISRQALAATKGQTL